MSFYSTMQFWNYVFMHCYYTSVKLELLRWFIKGLLLSADLLKLQVKWIKDLYNLCGYSSCQKRFQNENQEVNFLWATVRAQLRDNFRLRFQLKKLILSNVNVNIFSNRCPSTSDASVSYTQCNDACLMPANTANTCDLSEQMYHAWCQKSKCKKRTL